METKTKITQRDIILWHLQNIGTLTRAEAMEHYGWDRERFIKEFYKNYL